MSKSVMILFGGFRSSHIWWNYMPSPGRLKKHSFLDELSKLGCDIYIHQPNFFNLDYYNSSYTVSQRKKMFDPDINFKIKDLDFKNICISVHENVISKYGTKRKYIVIGHSYGGQLALLFSKMYPCVLSVCIDNTPLLMENFKKYPPPRYLNKYKKIADKYKTDKLLTEALQNIVDTSNKNNNNNNDIIEELYTMISYKNTQDRIKYLDNKLYSPTLFFRAYYTKETKQVYDYKFSNKMAVKERDNFMNNNKHNNFTRYIFLLDADHYVWNKEENMHEMITHISSNL